MIEFHEDEYLKSYVCDEILLAVLALCGQEEKDKLLIKKEDAACSNYTNSLSKTGTSR